MSLSPRRIFRAISWFPVFTVIIALVMEYIKSSGSPNTAPHIAMFSSPYFWLVVGAIVVAAFQTWVRYTKDWYDPKLALHYQGVFEGDGLCEARAAAAKQYGAHKKYDTKTKEVEIVLDIFEDIGFYVMHDEISAEVAHHHFYHWIRGYVQTASSYIEDYRRDEPTTYEHCKYLLDETTKIEAKKIGVHPSSLSLDAEEISEFIDEESRMASK